MLRKMLVVGCLLAVAVGVATAGGVKDTEKDMAMHSSDEMAAHQAELMKCDVCKHMVPHLASLGPVMTMDYAQLNDGVAMMHGVSDPAKLDEYRKMSEEMSAAGEACMSYTDAEAESQLCEMCQTMRSAMQAGARMSMGPTKMGDVMVLTSEDPAVQKQLTKLGQQCEMIMSQQM
jgi:hypothetical protein